MTSKDPHMGRELQRPAPPTSTSGSEQDKVEQIRQQHGRFLALVVVAALMDIATLAFLTLSAVIAANYFPDVPEKLAAIWKILGVLVLALSVAAKVVIIRLGSPILPSRSAANFSSVLRRQGQNHGSLIVWFDLRLIIRSVCLSFIAVMLAERPTPRLAMDWTAAVFFLISAGVVAINLLGARAQMPMPDDSLLGAVKLQIHQTRYRIRSAGNIWYFIVPFCVGVGLLGQNIPILKGAVPILASAVSPSLALAIALLVLTISLLAMAIVFRAQFRFIRGRQNHARERLGQLEQLLAELSEESKSNRGESPSGCG